MARRIILRRALRASANWPFKQVPRAMAEAVERRLLFTTAYTVTSLADTFANDGVITLREAIQAANTDTAFNEAPAGSGADTIAFALPLFSPGPATLTLAGSEIAISGPLTINGPGQNLLTIDANKLSRVFNIDGGFGVQIAVLLSGLTLARGNTTLSGGAIYNNEALTVQDCTIRDSVATPQFSSDTNPIPGGGAIYNAGATLQLQNSSLLNNSANAFENGGAVSSLGGQVTADGCTFSGNKASSGTLSTRGTTLGLTNCTFTNSNGAGVISLFGTVTITGCSFVGNNLTQRHLATNLVATLTVTSTNFTGGVGVTTTSATFTDCTISASRLGGLSQSSGTMTLTRCTISNNGVSTDSSSIGGVKSAGDLTVIDSTIAQNKIRADGGGIYSTGSLTVKNSTISGNSCAAGQGGGIYATNGGQVALTHCTITDNTSSINGGGLFVSGGTLSLQSSVIANNAAPAGPDMAGTASGNYNLVENSSGAFLIGSNNISGQDPMLLPLGNYGGSTLSQPPAAGSPLIDQAVANALTSDQRGVGRAVQFISTSYPNVPDAPGGDGADIGAVELSPPRILSWQSTGVHDRGVGDVGLVVPDTGSFTEPRISGIRTLPVTFDVPLDATSLAAASARVWGNDSNGQPVNLTGITSTLVASGNKIVTITFSQALPDYARYLIRLTGIIGADRSAMIGDNDRVLTALLGDVTGDQRVNNSDVGGMLSLRGIDPITATDVNQARSDVTDDGRINNTDVGGVLDVRGKDARFIADPIPPPMAPLTWSVTTPLLASPDARGIGLIQSGLNATSLDRVMSISGLVFNDRNGKGRQDSGEKGVSGFRVFLDANNNGTWQSDEASVISDIKGKWRFSNLHGGRYPVRVLHQSR